MSEESKVDCAAKLVEEEEGELQPTALQIGKYGALPVGRLIARIAYLEKIETAAKRVFETDDLNEALELLRAEVM